ncbi:hypothetical protein [Streptomyces sp. NPDC000851]
MSYLQGADALRTAAAGDPCLTSLLGCLATGIGDRTPLVGPFTTCRRTAVLSFRALFNWLQPSQFPLAMVATPIMELVFHTYLGDHLGIEDSRFFVLGAPCSHRGAVVPG